MAKGAKAGNNNAAGPHKSNGRRIGIAGVALGGPFGAYVAGNIGGKRSTESARRVVSAATTTGVVGGAISGAIHGAIRGAVMGGPAAPATMIGGAILGGAGGALAGGGTNYLGAKLGVRMTRPAGPPHSGVGMGVSKTRLGLHGK